MMPRSTRTDNWRDAYCDDSAQAGMSEHYPDALAIQRCEPAVRVYLNNLKANLLTAIWVSLL